MKGAKVVTIKNGTGDGNTNRIGLKDWNLKPLWTFMWVLGIPLEYHNNKMMHKGKYLSTTLIMIWGLLLFFLNVGVNLFFFWNSAIFQEIKGTRQIWTGSLINNLNLAISLPTVHLGWLAVAVPNWHNKGLLEVLLRMERDDYFIRKGSSDVVIKRFRRVFLIGFWLLLLALLSMIGIIIQSFILVPAQLAVDDLRYFFCIYLFLTLVVVCSFCRVAIILLENLNREIASALDENNPVIINRELFCKWQRRYQLISDLVEGINSSFGFVLLVFVVFEILWFVVSSFCTVIAFTDSESAFSSIIGTYLTVAFGLVAFGAFFMLAYQATCMKDLGSKCAILLRRLVPNDPTLYTQNLAFEVSLSIPKITACGFFEIDLSLIPIIIGTTLTYLLMILFQLN